MEKFSSVLKSSRRLNINVVHAYVSQFGKLILSNQIKAHEAMNYIAINYGTSKANVYRILRGAGAYISKSKPVVTSADKYEVFENSYNLNV